MHHGAGGVGPCRRSPACDVVRGFLRVWASQSGWASATAGGSPGPPASGPVSTLPVGGPISVEPRINDRIRVPEVRLVGPNGEQVGIVRIEDALRLA
ncbi:MAG TPA: hypothetical protein VII50_09005, partial [Acidothermaceae bacterium]